MTGTVDNMSLIASSIMSKKLAAGADAIVLDVKTGSGAFMKEEADSRALAEAMVDIGRKAGRKMAAVISDMDQPWAGLWEMLWKSGKLSIRSADRGPGTSRSCA